MAERYSFIFNRFYRTAIKKNKKMKKILTEAQYDQWLGMKQKPLPEPPKPEEVPSEEK
jgi:hypothetical protein